MAKLEGQVLKGRYRIEDLIGRGGMAEVYKAWDMRRQYYVAIKVMREDLAEDVEFVRRFRREAGALAALSHANVVRFYSFEREGRLAFIVMDYVEGTTLRGRILDAQGEPLPLEEVALVMRQVCAALHYAHGENVLHRDVKPGNIMIRQGPTDGAYGQVLVADFGIAKAADAATATTVMPGTPAYMSPEQCRSEVLDERADVYALGIVAYEMLAGRRPFTGATEATTGSQREKLRWEQMYAEPPPLRRFNPVVPQQVELVLLKALAKDPGARWPTVLAFWQAFDEALAAGGVSIPLTLADPVTPQPRTVRPSGSSSGDRMIGAEAGTSGRGAGQSFSALPASEQAPLAHRLRQVPGWAWILLATGILVVVVVASWAASRPEAPPPEVTAAPVSHVTVIVTVTTSPDASDTKEAALPPPTPKPTETVDEVATEVAKAAAVAATLTASVPTPTPTPTPTSTPSPTRTPRPTATKMPTPRPTATAIPTKRPTPKPTATRRSTGVIYPAPELVAPADWEGFKGRDTAVILSWVFDAALASDEYFLVETWTGPNFELYGSHLVKGKEFKLPPHFGPIEYWTTFGQKTRWSVTVVRTSGKEVRERVSPASSTRHLVWTEVS
jgi:serine/threonine protein kinase